jgi:hypothetical protein
MRLNFAWVHSCCLQVYERRKAPAGYGSAPANAEPQDSTNSKKDSKEDRNAAAEAGTDDEAIQPAFLGGGVRLEMNGLKAIAAISRELAGRVVSEGLYANKVLLHDTQGDGVLPPCELLLLLLLRPQHFLLLLLLLGPQHLLLLLLLGPQQY